MATVRLDDPPTMNVLGLFLAGMLRRCAREIPLRGALTIEADGMRATIRFEEDGVTITRAATEGATTVTGSLPVLFRLLTRFSPLSLLRVGVRGSRVFAWKALGYLRP